MHQITVSQQLETDKFPYLIQNIYYEVLNILSTSVALWHWHVLLIRCRKCAKQICHINFFSKNVCFSFSRFSLFKNKCSCIFMFRKNFENHFKTTRPVLLSASYRYSQCGQYFYLTLIYNRIRKCISTDKSPAIGQLCASRQ